MERTSKLINPSKTSTRLSIETKLHVRKSNYKIANQLTSSQSKLQAYKAIYKLKLIKETYKLTNKITRFQTKLHAYKAIYKLTNQFQDYNW